MNGNKNDLYLYILMRNDLSSMKAGRVAAQASHAANAFIHKHGGFIDRVGEWQKQTPQGFGTAIVLSASHDEITDALGRAHKAGITCSDAVKDPDYAMPFPTELRMYLDSDWFDNGDLKIETIPGDNKKVILHRPVITCYYIFGDKDALKPFIGHFPLYS